MEVMICIYMQFMVDMIYIYIYIFLNLLFTDIQFTQTVIVITPTFMIKLTVMGS